MSAPVTFTIVALLAWALAMTWYVVLANRAIRTLDEVGRNHGVSLRIIAEFLESLEKKVRK